MRLVYGFHAGTDIQTYRHPPNESKKPIMPAKEDNSNRTFSFDVVACLLAALSQSGVTVGAQHYKVMSKIDTSRTQHGYEHAFRPVKARAKEISDQIEKGDFGELSAAPTKAPAKKGKKAGVEVNGEKTGAKRGT